MQYIFISVIFCNGPYTFTHFSSFPEHLCCHFSPVPLIYRKNKCHCFFPLIPNFWHAWNIVLLSFISDGALLMSYVLHKVTHAASGLICVQQQWPYSWGQQCILLAIITHLSNKGTCVTVHLLHIYLNAIFKNL